MTREAAQPGADARRALYARLVLEHRLSAQDPLAPADGDWEREAAEILFSERSVAMADVAGLLSLADSGARAGATRIPMTCSDCATRTRMTVSQANAAASGRCRFRA